MVRRANADADLYADRHADSDADAGMDEHGDRDADGDGSRTGPMR